MIQTSTAKRLRRAERVLAQRVRPAIIRDRRPLDVSAWSAPGEPVPFERAVGQDFEPFAVGRPWGPPWSTTWFRLRGDVPPEWTDGDETAPPAPPPAEWAGVAGLVADGCAVELLIDLGFADGQPGFQAEGLVWRPDGTVVKGVAPFNQFVAVAQPGPIDVYVEAAANPDVAAGGFEPTRLGARETAGTDPLYTLRAADVVLRDLEVWRLAQDLVVVIDLIGETPEDSVRHVRLSRALQAACDAIGPDVRACASAARAALRPVLSAPANASATRAVAVGHAHIDSAWLWPVRESVRKVLRTFASATALADACPEFVFAASSAQQYQWVKDRCPDLFDRIKRAVAAGQWQPVGGMWVECDTNMTGGEALARQFVLGKEFFWREFGVETLDAWLPDTFGYSGALPQLVRQSGSRWFLSSKLSWNDTDQMPHSTFWWQGIDGSRVLVHLPPADHYGTQARVPEACLGERGFKDADVLDSSVLLYGWSDGGGGPTREMVASALRLASLEGAPRVEFGGPYEVFREAEARGDELATWAGEMYLEFHRGTYTSALRVKQGNRRCEHLAREAELWAATAAVREGVEYPYERLEALWRDLLLLQFHDILPGTSIAWVNAEAEATHTQVADELDQIASDSLAALVGPGDVELLANAAPGPRDAVPGLGVGAPDTAGEPARAERDETGVWLRSPMLSVHVTASGRIDSAVDVWGRQAVPDGMSANLLRLHHDAPRQWDAWDVDDDYRRLGTDLEGAITDVFEADGPAGVVVDYAFGSSTLRQTITLEPLGETVDIRTEVDWHERQRLLKLVFPCELLAQTSTAEIQFGHVQRPTHRNTSWDEARYEICAQRWLRVAEGGYGVSVANDSTYGHDVTTALAPDGHPVTVIGESLIRAPLFPDPRADQGRHTVLTVYRPNSMLLEAVADGYRANLPRRIVRGGHGVAPLVSLDDPGVVVECVKLAQDRSGDVVVRLYESLGERTTTHVVAGFGCDQIVSTDLLERPDGVRHADEGRIDVAFHPFEIVTLRFRRP